MKTKHEIITTEREIKEHMITCGACGKKFILNAVLIGKDDRTDESFLNLVSQSSVYYCPYCGEKEVAK